MDPFLWHKKTSPNALNKRLDGYLLMIFFLKKLVFAFLGAKNGCCDGHFFPSKNLDEYILGRVPVNGEERRRVDRVPPRLLGPPFRPRPQYGLGAVAEAEVAAQLQGLHPHVLAPVFLDGEAAEDVGGPVFRRQSQEALHAPAQLQSQGGQLSIVLQYRREFFLKKPYRFKNSCETYLLSR